MPTLAKEKDCTGCLACLDTCPRNAISIEYRNCIPYVKVDTDTCINCRLCERACPIITPVEKNKTDEATAYGGWAKDDEIRLRAASGGAFSAIAQSFLTNHEKAAVVGVTLKNNRALHILIESISDLSLLANSKYIQSQTQGIYKHVKQKLKEGYAVLFSGTPCQIAALYGFLGKRLHESLFTIEIVCHGVTSYEGLDIHLEHFQSHKLYSFRNKSEGQHVNKSQRTTIDLQGKPSIIQRCDDVFYSIFGSGLLNRRSCRNCRYSSINRVADITLADFWGYPGNREAYDKGVSLILSNNKRGNALIDSSNDLVKAPTPLLPALISQPRLYCGFGYTQFHPLVLWPAFFRKILPEKLRKNIITNRMPWKLIWGGLRILDKLHLAYKRKSVIRLYNRKG